MEKTKRPAREGKGVVCLLGRDTDTHNITALRAQVLQRIGVPGRCCGLIAALHHGEAPHG